MSEELNFSLPSSDGTAVQSPSKIVPILLVAVLISVMANIGIVLTLENNKKKSPGAAALPAEKQKQLALKLEKQGLNTASVAAWKEYIAVASLGDDASARIWYRIGKLYQGENQYDMALDGFYRSEGFAELEDISSEIARRTQECLESMGKFVALRYELADRVGMSTEGADNKSGEGGDQLVAEIGMQKIMESDLDRRIEHRIDQQISQIASYLPKDELNRKKEELLKQLSTNSQRRMFLNQYLLEEVLYRKARESRLMDDAEVKAALKDMERSMMAAKVVEKELADAIKITPGDLKTYYEANKQKYVRPEKARISHILVRTRQKAQDVRTMLEKGKKFESLAADLSMDTSSGKNGGILPEWIERAETGHVKGIGESGEAMNAIFSTDEGKVVEVDIEVGDGVHVIKVDKREPELRKTFDEVKNEVFVALRSSKEREVQQKLFADLKEKYNVIVHHSVFVEKDDHNNPQ